MKNGHSPINVAMITSAYPLGRREVVGGVEGVCYYLANALAADEGIRLHLFVAFAERYGFDRYTRLENHSLTIHAVPSTLRRSRWLSYLLFNPNSVLEHAVETHFDLIHFQNDAPWAARSRLPAVLTIHGLNERDTLFRGLRLTRTLRGNANRVLHGRTRRRVPNIIAISPYVRHVLQPATQQRVWDIENPVAESFFQVVREPVAGRVLFLGKITPLKNVAGLVDAFALAAKDKPGCELRLAGPETDRAYAEQCRTLVGRLGLRQSVKFLGSLSIPEIQTELARASLMALCSFQEMAPLVISEAMAAAVPVMASNVGGVPWMLAEGDTGYLFDPNILQDIARGLRLGLDGKRLGEMGIRAKAEAERRFRASVVARKTLEVYRHILHREEPGP